MKEKHEKHTVYQGIANMKRHWIGFLLGVVVFSGCSGARYGIWLFTDPDTKKVKAQFEGLVGHSVAVVIYTDERVQLDYPNVRLTLGAQIVNQLRENIKKIRVVDPLAVARYQDENLYWDTQDKKKTANDLKVDYVLLVSLLEFSTRAAGQMNAYQGRIGAEAKLYSASKEEGQNCDWETEGCLEVIYPDLAQYSPRSEPIIRR
ncbi:unnamed protein product, partial [marine sediment metagenome]